MENQTISDHFDRVWAKQETRVAIKEGGREVTFLHLLHWSQALSRALETHVREPGQAVALMMSNSTAFVATFFGAARAGAVVAPLSPSYRSQELGYFLEDLNPVALVTEPSSLDIVLEVLPRLAVQPAVLVISREDDVRLVSAGTGFGRPVPGSGSPPLLQQYTSGSTGVPKRVIRTHGALLSELRALRNAFDVTERDKFLGVAPFSHVNGLVRTMMTSMYVGATLYPMKEFRRREILDIITGERITFFGAVATMFTILSETPVRGDVNLSSLRVLFSSSAPLLAADNRRFQSQYGILIRQLYGSTETGTISFNRHPFPERYFQSVGAPLEGVRVDIVDEAGVRLPPGQEGEIAIASPFATACYLDNPAATAEAFRDGFYFSGDLGVRDETGYITLTGRKKLLINRGGFKVNPYEVEAAIKEHSKVRDVAVFGELSSHGDEVVSCVIVASQNCTVEEIILHCRDRIADFKIPSRIEFRDSFPTSPSGKILRSKLYQPVLDNRGESA